VMLVSGIYSQSAEMHMLAVMACNIVGVLYANLSDVYRKLCCNTFLVLKE